MKMLVGPSGWKRLSFSRSDWLSVLLALAVLVVVVTVILVGLAYALLLFSYAMTLEI